MVFLSVGLGPGRQCRQALLCLSACTWVPRPPQAAPAVGLSAFHSSAFALSTLGGPFVGPAWYRAGLVPAGERGPEHVLVEEAVCAGSESEEVPAGDVSRREEITSCRAVCSWPRDAGQQIWPSLGPGSGRVSSAWGLGTPVQDTPCRPSAGPSGPVGSAARRAVSTKTSESVNNLALRIGNNARQVTSCPLSGRRTQW